MPGVPGGAEQHEPAGDAEANAPVPTTLRDALAGELEGVRVAQLVRRKAAPDPGAGCEPAELGAGGGA